jgi:predicted TIM-barrel fold metal-dependent hydrolase
MKPFTFSADSHVLEPGDLFTAGLPASLKRHAIHTRHEGDMMIAGTEDKIVFRLRLGPQRETPFGENTQRQGLRDLKGRLADMEIEGVDAEICFPTLGLWLYHLDDPEAEAASARLYNDWNDQFLAPHRDRLVRCGMLPVLDFSNTIAELEYLAAKGYRAAMLPAVSAAHMPKYNDEKWDPVFAKAASLGIVFVMHTGTGQETVHRERGPGGANINYTLQSMEAQNSIMYLVAGGLLDRNPGAKVAFIESGASWLVGLAERLDEVDEAHSKMIRPKLSRRPSQIIDEQVWASFQHDRACILTAAAGLPGSKNIMWASDYPHAEGTFPISRRIVDDLFKGFNVSDELRRDILGLNAARLFGVEPKVHTRETLAA